MEDLNNFVESKGFNDYMMFFTLLFMIFIYILECFKYFIFRM